MWSFPFFKRWILLAHFIVNLNKHLLSSPLSTWDHRGCGRTLEAHFSPLFWICTLSHIWNLIKNKKQTYKTRVPYPQHVHCLFCKRLMFHPSFCTSVFCTLCLRWGVGCIFPAFRPLRQSFLWTPAHILCHIPVILPQTLAVGYWADKCLNDWDMIFATCWEPPLFLYFLICSFISFVGKVRKTFSVTQAVNEENRTAGAQYIGLLPALQAKAFIYILVLWMSEAEDYSVGCRMQHPISWGEECVLPPGNRLDRSRLWKYRYKATFSVTAEVASVTLGFDPIS